MGAEIVVGFLIAWMVRKASRVGKRADQLADQVLDAGLDRLEQVIHTKLGGDSAVQRLQVEAADRGEVSDRTRTRVELAVEEAAEDDPDFAASLQAVLAEVTQAVERGGAGSSWVGDVQMRARVSGQGRAYQVGQGSQHITEQ